MMNKSGRQSWWHSIPNRRKNKGPQLNNDDHIEMIMIVAFDV